jgi:hypothetical protein
MITMNAMDRATSAAEHADRRVVAGPPLADAEPPDLHGRRPCPSLIGLPTITAEVRALIRVADLIRLEGLPGRRGGGSYRSAVASHRSTLRT